MINTVNCLRCNQIVRLDSNWSIYTCSNCEFRCNLTYCQKDIIATSFNAQILAVEIICDNCGKKLVIGANSNSCGNYCCGSCNYTGIWASPDFSVATGLDNYIPQKNPFYAKDDWRTS